MALHGHVLTMAHGPMAPWPHGPMAPPSRSIFIASPGGTCGSCEVRTLVPGPCASKRRSPGPCGVHMMDIDG